MITLTYTDYDADGIFGKLSFDGEEFCNILTHAFQQPDRTYKPLVYPGAFTCIRGIHQLHNGKPFETFEITGVAGHSGVLFHQGNYNKDSEGCILLGREMIESSLGRMITSSMITFKEFMNKLDGVDSFLLEVKDGRIRIS